MCASIWQHGEGEGGGERERGVGGGGGGGRRRHRLQQATTHVSPPRVGWACLPRPSLWDLVLFLQSSISVLAQCGTLVFSCFISLPPSQSLVQWDLCLLPPVLHHPSPVLAQCGTLVFFIQCFVQCSIQVLYPVLAQCGTLVFFIQCSIQVLHPVLAQCGTRVFLLQSSIQSPSIQC